MSNLRDLAIGLHPQGEARTISLNKREKYERVAYI